MYSKQSFNFSPTSPIIAKKTITYKDNKYDFYNVEKEYLESINTLKNKIEEKVSNIK